MIIAIWILTALFSSFFLRELKFSTGKHELQSRHSFLSLSVSWSAGKSGEVSPLSSMGIAARRRGKVARRPKYALINTRKTEKNEGRLLMWTLTDRRRTVVRLSVAGRRSDAASPEEDFFWRKRRAAARTADMQPPRAIARRYLLPSRISRNTNPKYNKSYIAPSSLARDYNSSVLLQFLLILVIDYLLLASD